MKLKIPPRSYLVRSSIRPAFARGRDCLEGSAALFLMLACCT